MRRVLFATIVLVLLLGSFSSAFADEPQRVEQAQPATLGEVWWFYYPFGAPGIRVDAYMYRPGTALWVPNPALSQGGDWVALGWPFAGGPTWGTWWWGAQSVDGDVHIAPPEDPTVATANDSEQRRMNLSGHAANPDDPDPIFLYTDVWGYYYAEFMFSRDEVWFPCSYPLKWKCNYTIDAWTTEFHSPREMWYECIQVAPGIWECLDWPWALEPADTVSPLEVYLIDEFGFAWIIPFEITGYFWNWSDTPYPQPVPYQP
jgi:hypothetical protein